MNIEEAITSIQSMGAEDRRRMIYRMAVDTSIDHERTFHEYMWDWIEDNQVGRNQADGSARIEEIVGMLRISTLLFERVMSQQARRELQHLSENSQYGMKLADAMSSAALQLEKLSIDVSALTSHYSAVLEGRKQDIHFTDEEGTSVPFTDEEKALMVKQRAEKKTKPDE